MALYGYNGKILHVDLTQRSTRIEEPNETFYRIYAGGGLLATYYLLRETPPGIAPLGPENLLIFASSIVTGYPAVGLPRYVVCAKSPLTGGIGEARSEGPWGIALKKSGFDAIICYGASDHPVGLLIENGQVTFFDADRLWGTTVGEATDQLEKDFGEDILAAVIGPAGENLVRFASIVSNRTHQAARMGMGAVMGSKKLKAIVLRGGTLPPTANPEQVQSITRSYGNGIKDNPLTAWQKEPPGFAAFIHTHGIDVALDVENYRKSEFYEADNYKPEEFMKYFRGIAPCTGCPNDCIKMFHVEEMTDLDRRASGIHQEIAGTMGPNVGITDIKALLRANNLVNQLGLDPTSLGFTLSFAMELVEEGILSQQETDGLDLRFGNANAALDMTRRIAFREGFGNVLAEGSRLAAMHIGRGAESFAMQVKGLEMVPFEPRSQTNLALGFAVSPIGPRGDICEHDWDYDTQVGWAHTLSLSRTLGILDRIPMGFVGPEKIRNFKVLNNLWSGADALGLCIYAIAPTRLLGLREMASLVEAITGWETSSYEILRWGERRNHLMRIYNLREGITAEEDRLPDRFYDEPIPSGVQKGRQLDREKFHQMIKLYYEIMGWDENGIPRRATLYDHHLEWTQSHLAQRQHYSFTF